MVSADYFNIKVDNYISPVDPSTIIRQCVDGRVRLLLQPVPSRPRYRRPLRYQRLSVSPTIRTPATCRHREWMSRATIDSMPGFSASAASHGANWGQLDLALVGTWLNSRRIEQLPGLGTFNCRGLFGRPAVSPPPRGGTTCGSRGRCPGYCDTLGQLALLRFRRACHPTRTNPFLQGDPVLINARIPAYNYLDLAATWKIYGVELPRRYQQRDGQGSARDRRRRCSRPRSATATPTRAFTTRWARVLFVGATVQF